MSEYVEADSGARATPAGEVKMVIDEVRAIARKTMADLTHQAGNRKSAFGGDAKVGHAAFGQVPKAQAFAAHQEAARQVFIDTFQGVIEDLEAFQANLLACAEAHQANDESVQAGLLALSNRLSASDLASHRDYDNSSQQHRHGLLQGAPGDEHDAASVGTDDRTTTTPAAAPAHADAAPTPPRFS